MSEKVFFPANSLLSIVSPSGYEKMCLMRLHFERYLSHHRLILMIMLYIYADLSGNSRTWGCVEVA